MGEWSVICTRRAFHNCFDERASPNFQHCYYCAWLHVFFSNTNNVSMISWWQCTHSLYAGLQWSYSPYLWTGRDGKHFTIMSIFSSMMLCMNIKNVINILMILCEYYFFNVLLNRYLTGVAQDSGEPVLLRIAEEVMI